ncbi:DUF1566 domain-containing protein [bacterium]|nr:DUF1566 domain-containing protein [bacterium]
MKRFFVVFALFAALIFVVGCGGSSKNDNQNENSDTGETVNDNDTVDSGTTDNGDSAPDDDKTDTSPEQNDDNGDADDSATDDDTDTEIVPNPCDSDPCATIEFATGECESEGIGYFCECIDNYDWNGTECKQIAPICDETGETPCYDQESKLYWSSVTELGSLDEMTAYCKGIVDGYTGWYVPTIDDLRTLVVGCDKIKTNGICPITAENSSSVGFNHEECRCEESVDSSKLMDDGVLLSSTKTENGELWGINFDGETLDYDLPGTVGEMRCAAKKLTNLKVIGRICSGQNVCYHKTGEEETPWGFNEEIYEETSCSGIEKEFAGQDGQYAQRGYCVPVSLTTDYLVPGEDTVIDNNLKLEWQATVPNKLYTIEEAEEYCEDLVYAEHDDWRLPTAHELISILNFSPTSDGEGNSLYMDYDYFPNIFEWEIEGIMLFWTSSFSEKSEDKKDFFVVSPLDGHSLHIGGFSLDIENAFVRCVRGKVLDPKGGFAVKTVNGDKVVIDYGTHLIWKPSSGEEKTWTEALAYCEDLKYAGYDDWRLPNIKELESLINYSKQSPATDFPENLLNFSLSRSDFWSSTSVHNSGWAFNLDISSYHSDDGEIISYRKDARNGDAGIHKIPELCVR